MALSRSVIENVRPAWQGESDRRRERQKAEAEANRRAGEQRLAEAESYLLGERARLDAEEALSPQERTERRLRELEVRPMAAPAAGAPAQPRGFWVACEQVKARWRAENEQERAELEAKAGIPAWEKRRAEIDARRETAIRQARERCQKQLRESEQAAQERADNELAELGERPELREQVTA